MWTSIGVLAVDTLAGPLRMVGLLPSFATLAIAATGGASVAMWTAARGVPARLFLLPLVGSIAWTTVVTSPAIVAWAGSGVILLFALLAVGLAVSLNGRRRLTHRMDHPRSAWFAATATALWLIALLTTTLSLPLTGDEPRYLLVTQSVLMDGDVELTNNYDAETYRSFYPGPLERHVTLGYFAEQYSFHGLGLSLLLIPGFALGGVFGSRLFIVLVTAAGTGFFWSAARRITDSASAAWIAWLAMISAAPFALHGILLYPDGVAAAVTSFATWVLVAIASGRTIRALAIVGSGLALATLPWLHIRLSLSAGVFGLATVWALSRRQRDLILPFLAAPVISFVMWIASTWVMFRTLDPTAAFREKAAGDLAQAPLGTLGLLFDAEYGLLTYAPVLIFSVLGLAALWKRAHAMALVCAVLTITTLELGASWIWWGGDSAPARFLVPVVPLMALGFAAWLVNASSRARAFTAVIITVTTCITASLAFAEGGAYIVNAADGRATIWEWLSPNVDVSLALPSLFRSGATPRTEALIAASWIVTGAIAFALVTFWRRDSVRAASASWLCASAVIIVWLTVGASVAWWQRDASPWTPDRGQLRMLYAATSPTLSVGVHGPGWLEENPTTRAHFTTRASAVSSLAIATATTAPTPIRLHVPFVPAGQYAIDVEPPPSSSALPPPRLTLELGREASPFATWFAAPTATAPTFSLAVPIWSVRVISDSADAPRRTVRLRPRRVMAPPPNVDGYALRATGAGPLAVYSMDPYSLPTGNGIGLIANRQGSLIVADADGRSIPFVLHVESAGAPTAVAFERGAFKKEVSVMPGGPREQITVPEDPVDLAPLRFFAFGGSAVRDGRNLGAVVFVFP